jgi:hypothetical protein
MGFPIREQISSLPKLCVTQRRIIVYADSAKHKAHTYNVMQLKPPLPNLLIIAQSFLVSSRKRCKLQS